MSSFKAMKTRLARKESARWAVDSNVGFLFTIVVVVMLLRFSIEIHTTISYDEATYANVGAEALAGDFSQRHSAVALDGSLIFPIFAAISSDFDTDSGLHMLSKILNIVTIFMVLYTTLRLFDLRAAIIAVTFFGLSSMSFKLSNLAVADSLALPLLAIALYIGIVSAWYETHEAQRVRLLFSGALAGAAVLTKFLAVFFIPAWFLSLVAVYTYRKQDGFLEFNALLSFSVIVGGYMLFNPATVNALLENGFLLNVIPTDVPSIMMQIIRDGGVLIILGILGGVVLTFKGLRTGNWQQRIVYMFIAPLLLVAIHALLLYQIVTLNAHALWIYLIYAGIFLAPLAGYAADKIVLRLMHTRHQNRSLALVGMFATIILVSIFVEYTLDSYWGFYHSWPNVADTVEFLQDYGITDETRILAENAEVYEYYLDMGAADRDVWSNTFNMSFAGVEGLEAMQIAIALGFFDLVILDDFATPEKNADIRTTLQTYNYTLAYSQKAQSLSTGQQAAVEVYTKAKGALDDS